MARTLGIVVVVGLIIGLLFYFLLAPVPAEAPVPPGAAPITDSASSSTVPTPTPTSVDRGVPSAPTAPTAPTAASDGSAAGTARGAVLQDGEASRSVAQASADAKPGSLDKDTIQDAIKSVKPKIAECYEKALKHDPDLSGSLTVEFKIEGVDGGGSVTAGEVATSDMQAPFFEACVLKEIAHVPFPLPSGGGAVTVKYPFHFEHSHAD